jgi:hypothetical protein
MSIVVNINPKENNIDSKHYFTRWYENADGLDTKFLEAVKNAANSSEFPNIIIEDVTINTGGCFSEWKSESFPAIQFYSSRDDLSNYRCCFTVNKFGNILQVSLIFITHIEGGCLPALIKLASAFKLGTLFGGGRSLKADDYDAAFNNLVWMILDVADKTLDITPLHKEDASKSQEGGKKGGGFLSSLLG